MATAQQFEDLHATRVTLESAKTRLADLQSVATFNFQPATFNFQPRYVYRTIHR